MQTYLRYWLDMVTYTLRGKGAFRAWIGLLLLLVGVGAYAYSFQARFGLVVTNLSDQVGWGAYIANFTYLVGVSDAAILLMIPAYIYGNMEIRAVVMLGMMLAIAAIVAALLFIVADLGRPENFLHLLPVIGRLNFPKSVLAWDVLFCNGYLALSLHVPGYLLYAKYLGKKPLKRYYLPFIGVSIVWAVSVHTVTAFLYSGLGGRPYWNTAVLAPRFLVSSFACGAAILILMFTVVSRVAQVEVLPRVYAYLKRILVYTLIMNLFLLGAEVFKEFYTDSAHVAAARYLFFGLHGHGMLVPYIWSAVLMEFVALGILLAGSLRELPRLTLLACAFVAVGIWIEKGMGLVIPGFVPSPLGDIVEYTPSWIEGLVSLGIWALGALLFSIFAKIAIGIMSGDLNVRNHGAPDSP
jgi:Ni/Fe-hydrogenase subunit HybB-like protein